MTFPQLEIEITKPDGTTVRVSHLRDMVSSNGVETWSERIRVRVQPPGCDASWADFGSPSEDLLALFAGCAERDFFPPLFDRLAEIADWEKGQDVIMILACS